MYRMEGIFLVPQFILSILFILSNHYFPLKSSISSRAQNGDQAPGYPPGRIGWLVKKIRQDRQPALDLLLAGMAEIQS
jgi:hypothetical protein